MQAFSKVLQGRETARQERWVRNRARAKCTELNKNLDTRVLCPVQERGAKWGVWNMCRVEGGRGIGFFEIWSVLEFWCLVFPDSRWGHLTGAAQGPG